MEEKMNKVYIMLQKHRGFFPRLYGILTNSKYSHASISVDPTINKFYSFRMKWGFCAEHPFNFKKKHKEEIPLIIYSMDLDDVSYSAVNDSLISFINAKEEYYYSYLSLLLGSIGIKHQFDRGYFCSRFVASVLEGTGSLKKKSSVYRPVDFMGENLELKFLGKAKDVIEVIQREINPAKES